MRIDKILVQQGIAPSRTSAQRWIVDGAVSVIVEGKTHCVRKSTEQFSTDVNIVIDHNLLPRFVSRAGDKLANALDYYADDVANVMRGQSVLDVGQSTGGFTDCVLQAGAKKVLGIEVGHDQLDKTLCNDPRVTCWEGVNARMLDHDACLAVQPEGFDIVVMDVSFISQTLILPQLSAVMRPGALLFSLVKPQSEVGSDGVGKGGIVRDRGLYLEVEQKVCSTVKKHGWDRLAYIESLPRGADGNQEFFLIARKLTR